MTVFPACQLDSPLHQTRPGGLCDADAFRRRTAHQAYWTGVLRYLPSGAKVGSVMLVAIIFLTGCATQEAKIAIPVSCLKSDPPAMPQTLSEAELLAMNDYAATLQTYTERLLLKAYSAKADALLQSCR